MEGSLKGKLVPRNEEEPSKLKGKLLDNLENKEGPEKFTESWLQSQILIQRDGGDEFDVVNIHTSTVGSIPKKLVKLKSKVDGSEISKEFNSLIDSVRTPGSPWKIKE